MGQATRGDPAVNIADFFAQGGYALYVWGSYGVGFALMLAEIIHLRRQHRTILARLGRLIRMRTEVEHESQK